MFRPRGILAIFLAGGLFLFGSPRFCVAQEELIASDSGIASEAAEMATPAAEFVVREVVAPKSDITQPEGETKSRLARYIEEHELGPLGVTNFMQYAVRAGVRRGVPANTLVLILLFPLVTAIIAASRHLIGLRGFGIFVPAMLSVAFVATGVIAGIVLFLVILGVATIGRHAVKHFGLQYLPRMALLFWLISVSVFGVMLLSSWIQFEALAQIDIFSILILMLLAENFIEVQYGKSSREARELTIETMILSVISSLILSLELIQRFALLHPELLILMVGIFDVFMGRYSGLRYTEYQKFKKLLKD